MKNFSFCGSCYTYICCVVLLLSIYNTNLVFSKKTENEEKCIWFDECGPDPTPGRGSKILNCVYNGEPGRNEIIISEYS